MNTISDALRVAGVVACIPKRRIDNAFFAAQFGEAAVNDVVKMIGVESRYWVDDATTTADLCHEAANNLIDRLNWSRESIDGIVFVTQTPDYRLPATACALQARLGLSSSCAAFDVNLGCSGYVYGLWLASALLKSGCNRILLLVGDTSSKLIDMGDRSTAMLFGDAGTATAIEIGTESNRASFVLGTDGKGERNLIVPQGGYRPWKGDDPRLRDKNPTCVFMDGGEIFNFSLRAVPGLIQDALTLHGTERESVDAFLLHQANLFMLKHIGKKAKIPAEKMPINIDAYGNTSSASIPLLLTTHCKQRMSAGSSRYLLAGFGVGYSWGAAILDFDATVVVDLVAQ